MNRTARAALFVPMLALATGGAFTVACRGGGTLDGLDGGGVDGGAARSVTASGEACEKAVIAIDDTAAENAATGGSGCANDNECTVRMAGDYCACPNTP